MPYEDIFLDIITHLPKADIPIEGIRAYPFTR